MPCHFHFHLAESERTRERTAHAVDTPARRLQTAGRLCCVKKRSIVGIGYRWSCLTSPCPYPAAGFVGVAGGLHAPLMCRRRRKHHRRRPQLVNNLTSRAPDSLLKLQHPCPPPTTVFHLTASPAATRSHRHCSIRQGLLSHLSLSLSLHQRWIHENNKTLPSPGPVRPCPH